MTRSKLSLRRIVWHRVTYILHYPLLRADHVPVVELVLSKVDLRDRWFVDHLADGPFNVLQF